MSQLMTFFPIDHLNYHIFSCEDLDHTQKNPDRSGCKAVLQIRTGDRDNLGIISHIFP